VVSRDKLRDLLRRQADARFTFTRWGTGDDGFAALIEAALTGARRSAPVELLRVPPEAVDWLGDGRELTIPDGALRVRCWEPTRR
jgi:hypothetical protein